MMDILPLVDEAVRSADVSNPEQLSKDGSQCTSHEEGLPIESVVHGASVFDGTDAPEAAGSGGGAMDRGTDAPEQSGQRRTAAQASPATLSAPVQGLARATPHRGVHPGAHCKPDALSGHHNGNPVRRRSSPEILLHVLGDSPRRGTEMLFPLVKAPCNSSSCLAEKGMSHYHKKEAQSPRLLPLPALASSFAPK